MLPPLAAATSHDTAARQEDTTTEHGHSNSHGNSHVVVFEQTIDVEEDVTDFFDARFSSRKDLANIRAILKQQAELGQDLNHKVAKVKRVLGQCARLHAALPFLF